MAFRGSPDCVMALDPDGRLLACNQDLPKLPDAGTQPWLGGYFGEKPFSALAGAIERVKREQRAVSTEVQAPRPNGPPAWYRIVLTPALRDDRVHGITLVASDISAAKREEQRLRRSEEMMVDTQGVAHLGIWDWDIREPHASWSPELYKIYGLDPDEYVPSYENYLAMVHPDDRNRVEEATNAVFNDLKPYSHDERIFRADGEMRYLHTWAFPVLDDAGKLARLTGVCQDITDRKLAEVALAKHAAHLTRLNADLEQFARIAAHDLQEPLRTVASFVQLLEVQYRNQLDKDADETIDFIVEGVHRMKAIISDLQRYSQLKLPADAARRVDLNDSLARVKRLLAGSTAEAGAEISSGNLPAVRADPALLDEVLRELIANALRFRGKRPPVIEVNASERDACVEVCVRDNGIGIPPAHLERVFVIFQRLATGRNGTGVGLAICRKIIDLHGGRIWAESNRGEGAAIHFTLPSASAAGTA